MMVNLSLQIRMGNQYVPLKLVQISPQVLRASFPYNREMVNEIKSWEGASWNPDTKQWTVGYTERNMYCLRLLMDGKDNHYHNPPIEQPLTYNRDKLMSHQKEDVKYINQYKRVVLAGEPGIGKTLVAIEVMERNPTLYWVIVPKSAYWVWKYQLNYWNNKANVQLVMMHRLLSVLEDCLKHNKQLPGGLIIDEAHFFKNPSAKRTEALLKLCTHVRENNPNAIILPMTGTPAPRDPTDWWTLIEMCQPGFLRESTKAKLQRRLAITEDMGSFFKVIGWRKDEVEKLYRRMKGIVLINLAKDCLDLPPIIFTEQILPVSKEVLRASELIKKSCTRAITALIRLRQFSDGFQPGSVCMACDGQCVVDTMGELGTVPCPSCNGTGGQDFVTMSTPKDEALLEYLSDEDRDRIVIYAGFHQSIDKIEQLARSAGWQIIKVDGRGTIVDPGLPNNPQEAFIEGKGKIAYIGHPTAGGVSITLNKSDIIIFYSNDFNGASRMQAVKRIHRIGTVKATIVDLLYLPSDKFVLDNLSLKQELQSVTLGQLNEFWLNYKVEEE